MSTCGNESKGFLVFISLMQYAHLIVIWRQWPHHTHFLFLSFLCIACSKEHRSLVYCSMDIHICLYVYTYLYVCRYIHVANELNQELKYFWSPRVSILSLPSQYAPYKITTVQTSSSLHVFEFHKNRIIKDVFFCVQLFLIEHVFESYPCGCVQQQFILLLQVCSLSQSIPQNIHLKNI